MSTCCGCQPEPTGSAVSAFYSVAMHTARAEHQSQGWVGTLRRLPLEGFGPQTAGPAAQEAREHRHSQKPAWILDRVEVWDPGRPVRRD